jgi:hypothetical protein
MCAGAILAAGLKVVALAEDPTSGVHGCGHTYRMPRELWPRAKASMGFFEVVGRPGRVNHISPVLASRVPANLLAAAESSFELSLHSTRAKFAGSDVERRQSGGRKFDFSTIPNIAQIGDAAFLVEPGTTLHSAHAAGTLESLLADSAAVVVDAELTILLGAKGRLDISPARSSVLELVRAYTRLARLTPKYLGLSLPHPSHCSIVKRSALQDPTLALLEFGALGSFLEGPHLLPDLPAFGYIHSPVARGRSAFLRRFPSLHIDHWPYDRPHLARPLSCGVSARQSRAP